MNKPECLLGLLVILLVTIISACGGGDGTSSPIVIPCNSQVKIPDSNLETAIREAIGKTSGDICRSDLEKLTAFSANYASIADITGLEYCINLDNLSLLGNQISDISPLASLTNLTLLMVGENQIKDLSSISELTNLMSLAMPSNEISDISQLSRLTNLEVLWIMNNQIS
ncbi:leucine-rich repeat domain-containing protein, partial [Chloroflexota bacterium]